MIGLSSLFLFGSFVNSAESVNKHFDYIFSYFCYDLQLYECIIAAATASSSLFGMSVFGVDNRRRFLRSKTGADFRLRKSDSKIGAGFRPRVSSALPPKVSIVESATKAPCNRSSSKFCTPSNTQPSPLRGRLACTSAEERGTRAEIPDQSRR